MLANLGPNLPDELVLAGLASWAAMLGAVRLEAFGHVDTVFARLETLKGEPAHA